MTSYLCVMLPAIKQNEYNFYLKYNLHHSKVQMTEDIMILDNTAHQDIVSEVGCGGVREEVGYRDAP